MAIADDFTIAQSGDIRYVGAAHGASGAGYYTVIQLHRWLQDLADDAVSSASSSDFLDITDSTPSERSTDNIITLVAPYNIDDVVAEHLYDGSIVQSGGDVVYDGLVVIAGRGMDLQIVQNGYVIANDFWNTIPFGDTFKGLNRDTNNGISHRFMIKVRSGGIDIDGRRVLGQTRVWGKTFSEFRVNGTSRGNNVLALSFADDLNNASVEATVGGYTTITNVTAGYNGIDINNDTTDEYYYSEWNKASYTINQFYERMKYLSGQSRIESSHVDGGANYIIGNGTITRQAQSFLVGANSTYLTQVTVNLKKVLAPTGTLTAKLYTHTGSFGSTGTPNAEADASVTIDVSKLTTSYAPIQFDFPTPALMTAATHYFVSFEYSGGDASNYVHIEGDADGGHPGNRASWDGSWTASAGTDLKFYASSSPDLYGLPGELFRGITHEINVDTPTGTFSAVEPVVFGINLASVVIAGTAGQFTCTSVSPFAITVGQILRISGTFGGTGSITGYSNPTSYKVSATNGTTSFTLVSMTDAAIVTTAGTPTGLTYELQSGTAQMLAINSPTAATKLWFQLLTGVAPLDNQTIRGVSSGATCAVNTTVLERGLSFPFCGVSTGSSLIGAYGFGVEATDLSSTDKVFDLTNAQITPPNYVTFTVSGLVNGEDYVLVGPESGGTFELNQLSLNGTLSTDDVTSVVVSAAIPSDTPSTGTIRVADDNGIYRRLTYSSWTGSTFTITTTDGNEDFAGVNATTGNNVFISYIDKLATATSASFTSVFNTTRPLYVRVRDGGGSPIKTFETTASLGSGGGSATAIRTSDL